MKNGGRNRRKIGRVFFTRQIIYTVKKKIP